MCTGAARAFTGEAGGADELDLTEKSAVQQELYLHALGLRFRCLVFADRRISRVGRDP